MMLKVLIYGYATGVVSSRGLARKLQEDVAFRVLAAENFPSHRTLCEFRRRHLGDFKRMFVQVVRLAAETGVANFGKLSIDGTKVRANASKRKAMSYSRMRAAEKRLQGEIEALLDRAQVVDAEKHPAKARMAKKLATEAGRARYAERQVGDARGGRLRGLGPGRPTRGRGGRGEASGEGAHGQKAGDRGGPGAVRRAQVAVGGADRMDQGGAGFPAIQRAGPEQGPGRMGRMGSE